MPNFYVIVPMQTTQTVFIKADSMEDALERVDSGEGKFIPTDISDLEVDEDKESEGFTEAEWLRV